MTIKSEFQTLNLFGEHYRKVVATPEETDHANIRTFMRHSWAGIHFATPALQAKPYASRYSVWKRETLTVSDQ